MSDIGRDSLLTGEVPLAEGEAVLAEFRADAGAYARGHAILAVLGGAVAGLVLWAIGNPYPWAGPVAAVLAVAARAAILRSEAMVQRWRLTGRRLLGPMGQVVALSSLAEVRVLAGAVVAITQGGDKHLLKYLADPRAVAGRIEEAAGHARRRGAGA